MSFLNKRTPLYKTKREESPSRDSSHSLNWENFKCEKHPQLQIQALHHSKNTNTFSLVCVKCIIEGDYFSDGGDESITIKDLLDTCSKTINTYRSGGFGSPENSQERFMNFLLKDYAGTYEKYLERQAELVDREIEETINKLSRVREKYSQYFSKQLDLVRNQGGDIKEQVNSLLDNQGSQNPLGFSNMNEIYKKIDYIENQDELLEFFSELYLKSKEKKSGGDIEPIPDCSRLLERMENIKEKALNAKSRDVDVSRFESMQQNLQILLRTDSQAFKETIEGSSISARSTGVKVELETPRSRLLDSFSLSELQNRSESPMSPIIKEEKSYSAPKRRNLDGEAPVKKVKKNGGAELASASLRSLKKDLDKFDDEEDTSPGSRREKVLTKLKDWMNRRITGYLIFQNTMNSDPEVEKEAGISETGVHLNQAMGKKWKSLTDDEREEFKEVAKELREQLKQDLEDNADLDETDYLLEELDDKIKKLKRE